MTEDMADATTAPERETLREELERVVAPSLTAGLEKLTHELMRERLRVLQGVDWEDGFLPKSWEGINPTKWLGEFLLKESERLES